MIAFKGCAPKSCQAKQQFDKQRASALQGEVIPMSTLPDNCIYSHVTAANRAEAGDTITQRSTAKNPNMQHVVCVSVCASDISHIMLQRR